MFPDENNITELLKKYNKATGSNVPLFIDTRDMKRPPTPFDDYERIKCPDCGSDMMFRLVPPNSEGVNTQLVCSNMECDTVLNSEYTITDWFNVLRKKEDVNYI